MDKHQMEGGGGLLLNLTVYFRHSFRFNQNSIITTIFGNILYLKDWIHWADDYMGNQLANLSNLMKELLIEIECPFIFGL